MWYVWPAKKSIPLSTIHALRKHLNFRPVQKTAERLSLEDSSFSSIVKAYLHAAICGADKSAPRYGKQICACEWRPNARAISARHVGRFGKKKKKKRKNHLWSLHKGRHLHPPICFRFIVANKSARKIEACKLAFSYRKWKSLAYFSSNVFLCHYW